MNLSSESFATIIDSAFGQKLNSPYNPYATCLNFLIFSYIIPYVGLTGYVGASAKLEGTTSKRIRYIKFENISFTPSNVLDNYKASVRISIISFTPLWQSKLYLYSLKS